MLAITAGSAISACEQKPAIDRARFERVYQAGKRAKAALEVGTVRMSFNERLADLRAEISLVERGELTTDERELLYRYGHAIELLSRDPESVDGSATLQEAATIYERGQVS